MIPLRSLRIGGIFLATFAILWFRFSSGLVRATEVDAVAHWGLVTVSVLLGAAASAKEYQSAGSVPQRDALFGVSGALAIFSLLRLVHAL